MSGDFLPLDKANLRQFSDSIGDRLKRASLIVLALAFFVEVLCEELNSSIESVLFVFLLHVFNEVN